jgi:internalin A
LERSDLGVTLVITGPWPQEAGEILARGAADGLDLNYAKGFKDTDLQFMGEWPLRRLTILARTIKDLSPLYRVSSTLESLSLETSPSAAIDLERFPAISSLGADWHQVRHCVGALPNLEDLFLRGYTEQDLQPLRWNMKLRRLRLKDRPRLQSLAGLERFRELHHLGIYSASGLTDIDAISDLPSTQLVQLHLESCPVHDLGPISHTRSLSVLNASQCGDIRSLYPLAQLLRLEVLWLFGTTRIADGDLSPIVDLPRLRELRMQARREYSPSLAHVQGVVAERVSRASSV